MAELSGSDFRVSYDVAVELQFLKALKYPLLSSLM